MWRGPVFADVADEEFVRAEIVRLDEIRLVALEQRIAADIELGRHDALVEELRDLTAQYPFRERFWEQLMLALYRISLTDRAPVLHRAICRSSARASSGGNMNWNWAASCSRSPVC